MSSLRSTCKFMTALHYLDHLQREGNGNGGRLMLNRRLRFSKTLYNKDLFAHYGCVNAIEFSDDGEWLVSGGDDKRVLVWNVDKNLSGLTQPQSMKGEHNSNIFCLGFSNSHSKLFSAGNDEQVILHDVSTGEIVDVFLHREAVYGLSVDPVNESIFATAGENGSLLVWDVRMATNEPFALSRRLSSYHAVMYNPVEPRFLATANAHDGVSLWDIRKPGVQLMKYGPNLLFQSAMSVRFNGMGTHLLALRRRFPPVLYEITSTQPVAEFDHQQYYNSCTMKSCSFAGDKDQYVLSGSDDFKLYVWKIPDSVNSSKGIWVNKAQYVLRGHRSIVNQVRYNNTYGILASSGVEKIVKLWSSFPLVYREDYSHYISSKDSLRKVYSPAEFDDIFRDSGQFMTHDYSNHSVQEDPRMLAFFDSLVQRDIESWNDPKGKEKFAAYQGVDLYSSSNDSSSDDETENVVCSDDDNDDSATQSERSTQQLSMSLTYITKRALANDQVQDFLKPSEELDPLLDRIAILISQKRREEMLKTLKSIVQKNGQMDVKNAENKNKEQTSFSITCDTTSCTSSTSNVGSLQSDGIKLATNDKCKFWRKKRAELVRESYIRQRSSSSSSDTESDNATNCLSKKRQNAIESASTSNSLTASDNVCNSNSNGAIAVTKASSSEDTGSESHNCPANNVNGIATSSQSTDSNNCTYFPTKGGKRFKRNYRKRSTDDDDE